MRNQHLKEHSCKSNVKKEEQFSLVDNSSIK